MPPLNFVVAILHGKFDKQTVAIIDGRRWTWKIASKNEPRNLSRTLTLLRDRQRSWNNTRKIQIIFGGNQSWKEGHVIFRGSCQNGKSTEV